MNEQPSAVPYRCLKCSEDGSYYGRLVFSNEKKPPKCPVHKNELTACQPPSVKTTKTSAAA